VHDGALSLEYLISLYTEHLSRLVDSASVETRVLEDALAVLARVISHALERLDARLFIK